MDTFVQPVSVLFGVRFMSEVAEQRMEIVADGFVSTAEAATFLGIGRSKLYLILQSGELPYAKFGRLTKIPIKTLHEYAAKMVRGANVPE